MRANGAGVFRPMVAGAHALEDILERLNRRIRSTVRSYRTLIPRAGEGGFNRIFQQSLETAGTRPINVTDRGRRLANVAGAPSQQDEFNRKIRELDSLADAWRALIRRGRRGEPGRDITLPEGTQLGRQSGYINFSNRIGDINRGRNLIRQLRLIEDRAFGGTADLVEARRQQITRTIAGNIRETSIGPSLPTRYLQEADIRTASTRRLGPEPGSFSDPSAIQRLRAFGKREFDRIIEEERVREENRNETLKRLKAERIAIRNTERRIKREQQELQDSSLFDEVLRQPNTPLSLIHI